MNLLQNFFLFSNSILSTVDLYYTYFFPFRRKSIASSIPSIVKSNIGIMLEIILCVQGAHSGLISSGFNQMTLFLK